MFEIRVGQRGMIAAIGRLDASRIDAAKTILDAVTSSATVDLGKLDYISSVGIGLFVATFERLRASGQKLTFTNTSERIKGVFRCVGLHDRLGIA